MSSPYLSFGLPRDGAALAALVAALAALVAALPALRQRLPRLAPRALLTLLATAAALLSAAYVAHYLRGGPRIVDAASYYLEGHALSHGFLRFDVPLPSAAFRGRFLLTPDSDGSALAVIFPPGYPALLALGFWLGSPLAVGPLLAFALVLATYWLCRELLAHEGAALLAALLSAVCAALRYHTADTMSHGLSALLFAVALASAARGGRSLWLSGFSLGWLLATRPLTGVVALLCCALAARRHGWRALSIVPALIPGLSLLLLHQHAATGEWLGSSQLRYYALADGPPGCFRYGFGRGIGCLFEHGDYVRARLPLGYGPLEALQNTLRRLWVHSIDVTNFVPFTLLLPYCIVRHRRRAGVLLLGGGVLALVLAYSGFYFDGSYPGGGARLFADVLPLEHALLAFALCELGLARIAPSAALLGFALHAAHGHLALRDREGGRPMFERRVLRQAKVERGLVFISTDHGFALGHDPSVADPWRGVMVARERNDAHDLLLWERFGRPPSFRYRFDVSGRVAPELVPYEPELTRALRFEAEADWPPLAVSGGFAHPDFHPAGCVSQGRGLRLQKSEKSEKSGNGPVSATIELVPRDPGPHELWIQWLSDPPAPLSVTLRSVPVKQAAGGSNNVARELRPIGIGPCFAQAIGPAELASKVQLELVGAAQSTLVDYIELRPASSKLR